MTIANRTVDECDRIRAKCPGRRAISLAQFITIVLALAAAIGISYAFASANAGEIRATGTEVRLRAQQTEKIENKLDRVLAELGDIKSRLPRSENP